MENAFIWKSKRWNGHNLSYENQILFDRIFPNNQIAFIWVMRPMTWQQILPNFSKSATITKIRACTMYLCTSLLVDTWKGWCNRIGVYSAKRFYFFPGWRKNCEKIFQYFLLYRVENCPKLLLFWGKNCQDNHFFGKICQKLHFFGYKLQEFANLRVKSIKICTFWG